MNLVIALVMWIVIIAGLNGALPEEPIWDIIWWVFFVFGALHVMAVIFGLFLISLKGR